MQIFSNDFLMFKREKGIIRHTLSWTCLIFDFRFCLQKYRDKKIERWCRCQNTETHEDENREEIKMRSWITEFTLMHNFNCCFYVSIILLCNACVVITMCCLILQVRMMQNWNNKSTNSKTVWMLWWCIILADG